MGKYVKRIDKRYSLVLLSLTAILFFLIVFLSTEPIATAKSDSSAEYAYVPNEQTNDVSVINTTTNTVVSTVPIKGNHPIGVAVSPNGTKVYVTNFGTTYSPGLNISVIDTATEIVTTQLVKNGSATSPLGIAVASDDTLYVANFGVDTVEKMNLLTNFNIPIHVGIRPNGIVINPNGTKVYVTSRGSNNVSVIDTATNDVTTVNVGSISYGIAINPSGTKVYVTNIDNKTVSIIDTANNTVTDT